MERCFTWNEGHFPPDICHTVRYLDYYDSGSCDLLNSTYSGHNTRNDFDNDTAIAYGLLLDEFGNID